MGTDVTAPPAAWDGDTPADTRREQAAIVAAVAHEKQGDRKLRFFKTTPERIEFVSRVYVGLHAFPDGAESVLLGPSSVFTRVLRDYQLVPDALDPFLESMLTSDIESDDLRQANKLLGKKSLLGRLVGKEEENYQEIRIAGGWPNEYPSPLRQEMALLHAAQPRSRDGPDLPGATAASDASAAAVQVIALRARLLSDIEWTRSRGAAMAAGVAGRQDTLRAEREQVDAEFREQHGRVVLECEAEDEDVSRAAFQELLELQRAFAGEMSQFTGMVPRLHAAIADPNSFGGIADVVGAFVSGASSDRPYHEAAHRVGAQARACRSVASDMKAKAGDDRDAQDVANAVTKVANEAETVARRIVGEANAERSRIWSRADAVKREWNSRLAAIDGRILGLEKGLKAVEARLERIREAKRATLQDVEDSILMPAHLPSALHLPLWVACLSKGDERRFLVFGPLRARTSKGLRAALQSFTMPFEPYSEATGLLAAGIEKKLNSDAGFAQAVEGACRPFNRLTPTATEEALQSLIALQADGWVSEKGLEAIREKLA